MTSPEPVDEAKSAQRSDWRLGPIVIERKTSFASLAAFLIAVFGVFSLIRGILFGPELHVSGVPHVYVYQQACFRITPGRPFLAFGVPLHMANIGEKDHALIVTHIEMTVAGSVAGTEKRYAYKSSDLAKFSRHISDGKYLCPQDNHGSASLIVADLKIEELDNFHDVLIPHGKDVRQHVIFMPAVSSSARFQTPQPGADYKNYLWWDDLVPYLNWVDFNMKITLTFHVNNEGWIDWAVQKISGGKTMTCEIPFDPVTRDLLLKRKYVSRQASCSTRG